MTTCWSVIPSDLPPTWMSCSGMAQYPSGWTSGTQLMLPVYWLVSRPPMVSVPPGAVGAELV